MHVKKGKNLLNYYILEVLKSEKHFRLPTIEIEVKYSNLQIFY